jgi:hypothetical protein
MTVDGVDGDLTAAAGYVGRIFADANLAYTM